MLPWRGCAARSAGLLSFREPVQSNRATARVLTSAVAGARRAFFGRCTGADGQRSVGAILGFARGVLWADPGKLGMARLLDAVQEAQALHAVEASLGQGHGIFGL